MRPLVDRYRPADRAALYDICLRTGASGTDASDLYADPRLLGDVYLGPYLELEPGLAFVVRAAGSPEAVGYVVGTADTTAFEAACEDRWWPPLRDHYRAHPPRPDSTDARFVATVEAGVHTRADWLARYPAHLHINQLAPAHGGGGGRALLTRLLAELENRGVPGVHLGASSRNTGAHAFYRRLGFTVLAERPGEVVMGRSLGAGS